MRSLKAIIAGCVFIVVVILLMQLLYIFVAVGYNALAKGYPFLNDISGLFRYIVGIPVFVIIMFAGGYITRTYGEGALPWMQVEMNRSLYLSEPWFDAATLTVQPQRLEDLNQKFRKTLALFFQS